MLGRSLGALSNRATIVGLVWSTQRAGPAKAQIIASIQGPALDKLIARYVTARRAGRWSHGRLAQGCSPGFDAHFSAPRRNLSIDADRTDHFGRRRTAAWVWVECGDRVFSQVDRDQDLGRVRIDNLARYLRDLQSK